MLRLLTAISFVSIAQCAPRMAYINMTLMAFDDIDDAEPIRLILHYRNNFFYDRKIKRSEWASVKSVTPFGRLPVYYIEKNAVVEETWAIYRYMGRRLDLFGRPDREITKIDSLSELFRRWHTVALRFLSLERSNNPQASAYRLAYTTTSQSILPIVENELAKAGDYFLDTKITWIDFVVAHAIKLNNEKHPEVVGKYPRLLAHSKRVYALPELQKYLTGYYDS